MQITLTSLLVEDQDRALAFYTSVLGERGVKFRGEPKSVGPVTVALFEDGCGNLINLVQPNA